MKKKLLLLSFCLISIFSLRYYLSCNTKKKSLEKIYKQDFQSYKKSVFKYLEGSWCSKDKANLIMDHILSTKPEVCVEIGLFSGSSFIPIAATLRYVNHGIAFGIDPWSNGEAAKGLQLEGDDYKWWSSVNMLSIYNNLLKAIDKWGVDENSKFLRMNSLNASGLVPEIDFLHIDGNFSEKGCLDDVLNYLPKVKKDGYVLISNIYLKTEDSYPKMKALWVLLEKCEVISEIEDGNTVLFQKN